MTCATCGHPTDRMTDQRTLIGIILRRPVQLGCDYLDETDIGNGWAGGNTACGCTHKKSPALTR